MALDEKSSQEHPVNAGVTQSSFLGPTAFLLCLNDLPDDVIFNIAIYADILHSTLSVIRRYSESSHIFP